LIAILQQPGRVPRHKSRAAILDDSRPAGCFGCGGRDNRCSIRWSLHHPGRVIVVGDRNGYPTVDDDRLVFRSVVFGSLNFGRTDFCRGTVNNNRAVIGFFDNRSRALHNDGVVFGLFHHRHCDNRHCDNRRSTLDNDGLIVRLFDNRHFNIRHHPLHNDGLVVGLFDNRHFNYRRSTLNDNGLVIRLLDDRYRTRNNNRLVIDTGTITITHGNVTTLNATWSPRLTTMPSVSSACSPGSRCNGEPA